MYARLPDCDWVWQTTKGSAEGRAKGQEGNGELWVVIYTDWNSYSPLVCVAMHYRDSDCDDVAYD